jgi:uncharacterized protein
VAAPVPADVKPLPLWAWSLWRLLLFVILFLALTIALGAITGPVVADAALQLRLLVFWIIGLATACLAGLLLLRVLDRRGPAALGFAWTARTPAELIYGFGIGGGALAVAAGALLAMGYLRYEPAAGTATEYAALLGQHFVVIGVAAAGEEALFRGYPFQVLVQWLGAAAAMVLASAAFAAAHLGNPEVGPIALANIFLAGILLSIAYLRTHSLWFATGVHAGWNFTMAAVFDLPVSGITWFYTPVYDARVSGPDWLTGGDFGVEGGALGTMAFGIALLAVLRLRAVQPARENLAARALVADRQTFWLEGNRHA